MSDTPLVRLINLRKGFSKGNEPISIFDGLNLAIPPGDFAAVMGPSGSGKTTLLNLLGGIDRPDAGEIEIAGRRIDRLSEGDLARWRAANIGFVFQFYNLMPMLSAAQNVELPLLLTNLRAKARRERVATSRSSISPTGRPTIRVKCRVGSSSAWPLPARSSPIRSSSYATSRPAISTAPAPTRSSRCSRSSTAISARPSSW